MTPSREHGHGLAIRWPCALGAIVVAMLTGCAGEAPLRAPSPTPAPAARTPESIRAEIASRLPASLGDRAGWAADVYAALTALKLPPTPTNYCAVLAVAEQESTYRVDPPVAGLPKIARDEIFRRAERLSLPALGVRMALQLNSPNGKTWDDRVDDVRTEGDLSRLYEELIAAVPLGNQLLAGKNPVHTAGPMQVSIAFAEAQVKERPYPWEIKTTMRHELFTRRGGLYFGTAHLLDYPAPYGNQMIYRFADFNAGRWASRNAAFQQAVSAATGQPLDPDGDLLLPGASADTVGSTERAVRSLSGTLGMSDRDIRQALAGGDSEGFERTTLYTKVMALATQRSGQTPSRAALPHIELHSPKFTRKLTTEWFAQRVNERYQRCLGVRE